VFMRRVNGGLTIFWIVMIPFSIATGWINSVTYVAALSLWALVSGHWSAWQAARVEVAQAAEEKEKHEEEEEEEEEEDVAADVVEHILRETEQRASSGSGDDVSRRITTRWATADRR
jgi:type VI protein secretion system component VasK